MQMQAWVLSSRGRLSELSVRTNQAGLTDSVQSPFVLSKTSASSTSFYELVELLQRRHFNSDSCLHFVLAGRLKQKKTKQSLKGTKK